LPTAVPPASADPSATPKTIHFISLGCPKNRVDTEVMLGVSGLSGYELVARPDDAAVIVVNTCGFIGEAKEESVDTILEMGRFKEAGSCERLVVAGCLSQRYPEQLAEELPEVDHFLGSSDMLKLKDVLASSLEHPAARMLVGNPADYVYRASDPRTLSVARHSAWVKIAEGCNRTCSFCAIPSIRGAQRSRPVEDVVREVEQLVALGTVEVNLVSQDTISYGRDLDARTDLATLVRRVADVKGLRWLRLFYLYPERLSDGLIELLAQHPVVLPYVDMPLQHASTAMLRRMRRGHYAPRLREVVETLRTRVPDLTFRSAFIVGHPGETDADFDELCDFVRWAEFDRVVAFRYSHEEGTRSGDMADDVPAKVAAARHRKLMTLQRGLSKKKLKRMIGREIEVLVEGVSDESELLLEGRHRGQAPEIDGKVHLANGTAPVGTITKALVTHAADYDLVADLFESDGTLPEPPPGARPRAGARRGPIRLPTVG
jgi:ribosomal protein S12 methylthiotransferase